MSQHIIALDIGNKRVGVAIAALDVRMAQPLTTITNDEAIFDAIQALIDRENVVMIVAGLPRGLEGQHTDQTRSTEAFVAELEKHILLPIAFQDEALTSKAAEDELEARGKSYSRGDIDALAASYILGDYLTDHPVPKAETKHGSL